MAIARSQLHLRPPDNSGQMAEFYRRALLELLDRAKKRLVKDGRMLTSEARRARLLIREIGEILEALEGERSAWIAENVPKAYMRGVRVTDRGLAEIGAGAINASITQPLVHREAIEVLVNDLQDALLDADESMVRGFRRMVRRTQLSAIQDRMVTEQTALGIAEGKGRRELSKALRTRLIDEYGDKPIRINGRNYQVDKYAEMVARTKTAEAQTAGTVNRVLEAGHDLVMISAHGATDSCGDYEGKVFSITGTSDRYPPLSSVPNGGPPFHPNCKHATMPFVEELASETEKRKAVGVPESSLGKTFAALEKERRAA